MTNTPIVFKKTNMVDQKYGDLKKVHFARKLWSQDFKIEFFQTLE